MPPPTTLRLTPYAFSDPYWLSRKVVLAAVGGRYRLAQLERAGCLIRHYPAGLRRARYPRAQVLAVIGH